jgi:hypothetical protein
MDSKFDFLTPDFIKGHEKATGIRIIPTIFPWRWLDCTDEAFLNTKMTFSNGQEMPEDHKQSLLRCIRNEEKVMLDRRNFTKKREKVMGNQPKYVQLELF